MNLTVFHINVKKYFVVLIARIKKTIQKIKFVMNYTPKNGILLF